MDEKDKTDTQVKNKGGRPRVTDQERKDVRLLALKHTSKAVAVLKHLMIHGADNIKLQAATALLDRGYGKPVSVEERKVEQTVKIQHNDMELARRTAFLLEKAQVGTHHGDVISVDHQGKISTTPGVERRYSGTMTNTH